MIPRAAGPLRAIARNAAARRRPFLTVASPSTAESAALAAGVDTTKYPLHDLDGAGKAMIDNAQASLKATGCASFPGFLRADVAERAAAECAAMAPDAFVTDDTHNAYQNPTHDDAYPDDHVRNLHMRTRVASTAYDELRGTALRDLYDWDGLVAFIGRVLGYDAGAFHRPVIQYDFAAAPW